MRIALAWLCGLLVLAACGCRGRSDLVEAELRTREREIGQLRAELQRARAINEALERELGSAPPFPHGELSAHAPGSPLLVGSLEKIELGRGTGGIDEDHVPGDEALFLVVVPRDADGSAFKVPGSLHVTAFEVTPQGVKLPLSSWQVSSAELRPTWQSGLFSTGYHVRLNWQTPPSTQRLRVVVQMRLLDGKVYETDKDIPVRPLLNIPRPPAVPPQHPPGEPPSDMLPPPTPLPASYRVEILPPRPLP